MEKQARIMNNEVLLNLESLEDGYYRVFIKINGQLEWHNIYKGSVDITSFIDRW